LPIRDCIRQSGSSKQEKTELQVVAGIEETLRESGAGITWWSLLHLEAEN
jgi:hypothetical protein